jgi:hypothetical protein
MPFKTKLDILGKSSQCRATGISGMIMLPGDSHSKSIKTADFTATARIGQSILALPYICSLLPLIYPIKRTRHLHIVRNMRAV